MNYKKILFNDSYLLRYSLLKNKNQFNLQKGGFDKKYDITFENKKYIFTRADYDKNNFILLSPKKTSTCVLIAIIKELRTAQIENINGDFPNCMSFSKERNGSFLLRLTLTFLKKYKDEFDIDWIITVDHSKKKCGNKFFKLMNLSFLTDGDSWYGKYNFLPIDQVPGKIKYDKNGLKKYYKNREIMKTVKVKDINFEKYISKVNKKYPKFKLDTESYENMLLKDYLKNFLIDYELNCKYFHIFYEDLFDDLGLENINNPYGEKIR